MSDANVIEAKWQNYLAKVIPAGASEIQVIESRKAFYAGVSAVWQLCMSDEISEAMLNDIDQSLLAWIEEYRSKLNAEDA